MTGLATVVDPIAWCAAVAGGLGCVGAAVWGAWWRHVARRSDARAGTAGDRLRSTEARLAAAVAERDEAMDLSRQWMAETDRLIADAERHAAQCLGELVPDNDGVTHG